MPLSNDPPEFWIFGGPNGSGKSTTYDQSDVEGAAASIWIVNPDLLAAKIRQSENLELLAANLEAVTRLELWLEATLRVHKSVGVETVMSTPKYRRLVDLAHSLGFVVHLFYVMLDSPERNIERVAQRVLKGGHDVPSDKIVERYWRSLSQLPWFFEESDFVDVYDNSGERPRRVASKTRGVVDIASDAPVNLLDALAPLLK